MNKQSQWLFETPLALEETARVSDSSNQAFFSNPEWEVQTMNPALGEAEWEALRLPQRQHIVRETVSGFPRHSNLVRSLPPKEQQKIDQIARLIVDSYRPGQQPIRTVQLIGHADKDTPRRPDFEKKISGDRALEVKQALITAINRYSSSSAVPNARLGKPANSGAIRVKAVHPGIKFPTISSQIQWQIQASGATQLVVHVPQTERDRARNRRVEVIAQRSTRKPPSKPPKKPPTRFEIKIAAPVSGQTFFIEPNQFPGANPSMPTLNVSAQAQMDGKEIKDAVITWKFKVLGNYRVRTQRGFRLQDYAFDIGTTTTISGQASDVDLTSLTHLIVGGDLEITALFKDPTDNKIKAVKTVRAKILGKNPSRDVVENMIRIEAQVSGPCGDDSWLLLRIFCHESAHALQQFNKAGQILYGPPAGVGIVQRDPEASEWKFPKNPITTPNHFFPRIFWNWQENIREGIQFFRRAKLHGAQRHLRNLQIQAAKQNPPLKLPDPCLGVLLREAVRQYNGGTEYRFKRIPHTHDAVYVSRPQTKPANIKYVDTVLRDPHITDPIPNDSRHILSKEFPQPGDIPCDICNF
jgi:outer membrane protein OmpA-like peptidoglycan-associated protein